MSSSAFFFKKKVPISRGEGWSLPNRSKNRAAQERDIGMREVQTTGNAGGNAHSASMNPHNVIGVHNNNLDLGRELTENNLGGGARRRRSRSRRQRTNRRNTRKKINS